MRILKSTRLWAILLLGAVAACGGGSDDDDEAGSVDPGITNPSTNWNELTWNESNGG